MPFTTGGRLGAVNSIIRRVRGGHELESINTEGHCHAKVLHFRNFSKQESIDGLELEATLGASCQIWIEIRLWNFI